MEIVINSVWELLLGFFIFGIGWGIGETIATKIFNNKEHTNEDQ